MRKKMGRPIPCVIQCLLIALFPMRSEGNILGSGLLWNVNRPAVQVGSGHVPNFPPVLKVKRVDASTARKKVNFRVIAPRNLPFGFQRSFIELGWAWKMGSSPERPALRISYSRPRDGAQLDVLEDKSYGIPRVNVFGLYDPKIFNCPGPPFFYDAFERVRNGTDILIVFDPRKVSLPRSQKLLTFLAGGREFSSMRGQ